MRGNRSEYLWVFAILIALEFACSSSTARIVDAQLAKEVNDQKEPINPTTTFDISDPVIHCIIKLADVTAQTKLKASWVTVNVEGIQPNQKVANTELVVDKPQTVDFTFTPYQMNLPAGNYKVDIYISPKSTEADRPTQSIAFSIKSSPPAIVKAVLSPGGEEEGSKDSFKRDTAEIHCHVTMSGNIAGTTVMARWMAISGDGEEDSELAVIPKELKRGENKVDFSLGRPDIGFPTGQYRIELYLGDSKRATLALPFTITN
ncbi:MAG: hypothetical protein AB1489_12565 [Acidobacteriota bacterium]